MKIETLNALAKEARNKLTRDNKRDRRDRNFAGRQSCAAEYVYFRAMREERVEFCDDRKENEKNIREVLRAMRDVTGEAALPARKDA